MTTLIKYKFSGFTVDLREKTLCKNGETLKTKSRNFQVLRLLLENAGSIVTKEDFFREIWTESFVEENNLTVAVAQIRRILGETKDAKFIGTASKQGYRFVCEVESVFDESKAKKSSELAAISEVEKENSIEKPTGKSSKSVFARIASHPFIAVAALVLLILSIGAFWRQSATPTKIESFQSIAVLPFSTERSSPENQIFAEKLTQDLIYNLGRITDVRLTSYETIASFDSPDDDTTKIAADLKIDALVAGKIKNSGEATNLEIKISDSRAGKMVWEKSYSVKPSDLAQLQHLVARDIARELGKNKESQSPAATANYEAYQSYLLARHHLNKGTTKDYEKAIENFTRATFQDASFADAHSGLATAHILHGINLYAARGLSASRQSFPAAIERAKRALELKPDPDEALTALAFVNYRYEYD